MCIADMRVVTGHCGAGPSRPLRAGHESPVRTPVSFRKTARRRVFSTATPVTRHMLVSVDTAWQGMEAACARRLTGALPADGLSPSPRTVSRPTVCLFL